jgi:hypothetical protein
MSSRREQKENLRRERERREAEARAAAQRKRLIGVVTAVAIAVVAIVVVVAVAGGGDSGDGGGVQGSGSTFPTGGSVPKQTQFDLDKAASAAGCELTSNKAPSRDHIQDPNQKVKYAQNPPDSGKHFAVPAEDGLYNGAPPKDTALVHELEHGRVIIWAKPTLPREARQQLRALFDEDKYQMVVVRRPDMPYAVAATAWGADPTPLGTGYSMGCTRWDPKVIDALRTFRDEHRSNGPEPIP